MYGFVSILGHAAAGELQSMATAVLGRNMDERSGFESPPFAVMQQRLTMIGADACRAIPMQADDVVVVLHGCIYNYQTLKTQLEQDGITFISDIDSEIIPHLYRRFGLGMFNMLEGMFSLVLWDKREQICLLARDTFGEKPLFVCEQGGRFGFSSSQDAFEQGAWSLTPNLNSVYNILTRQHIEAPQSMYEEIAQLPAGCYALARVGQPLHIRRYFFLPEPDQPLDLEAHEIQGEVKSMLVNSMAAKTVSDQPLGVLLSGDVNTSLLAGMLKQDAGQDVHSFGVRFASLEDHAQADASSDVNGHAKQIATHLGMKHTTLDVRTTADQALDDLVAAYDVPVTNVAAVSTYLTSQAAKQHVDVLLSGVGSDALFGGHARYLGLQWHDQLQRHPAGGLVLKLLDKLGGSALGGYRSGRLRCLLQGLNQSSAKAYQHWTCTTHAAWSAMFVAEQQAAQASLWRSAADVAGGLSALLAHYGAANGAMIYDVCTSLSDDLLATSDRMSIVHGLEMRAPFLDAGLFSFVATLDASYKVKGMPWQGDLKVMLKSMTCDYLPNDVVFKTKQSLVAPIQQWLRADLKGDIQAMMADKPLGGLVRASFVQAQWDKYQKGEDKSDILWGLLLMHRWMQRHGWQF